MKCYLKIGGIAFFLDAERPLRSSNGLAAFRTDEALFPELTVRITWDWHHVKCPKTHPVGRDLVQIYYRETDWNCCELDGGDRGALALTWYRPDFSEIICCINNVTCPVEQNREEQVLRMLPMREIFLHFGVLFLHASQISFGGKGILFAAPSGTGKTTQAKLWQRYRGAEIVCNDRTLTRRIDGQWKTYGYPIDGSEPVHSSAVNDLGAVVLLEQGSENRVSRLRPVKALSRLMEQVVLDCWSGEARTAAMELLVNLMEDIPVYLLTCTADAEAVEILDKILTADEVIPDG